MLSKSFAIVCLAFGLSVPLVAQERETRIDLQYRPGPAGNPLKGLVPYEGDSNVHFPHSMEFTYVGFAELVKGYDAFDWEPLDRKLDAIASRGHQAIFRVYLEYPGKSGLIPRFLIDDGLHVHKYLNTNTQPLPPAEVETPDYEDKRLRRSLKSFIAALGSRYDGDSRIAFITAGLLGTWGEWHTYPKEEFFASKEVQVEVMEAYESSFRLTPILLRYPAGEKTWGKAPNAQRRFGYHDDSFAWATLITGKESDSWFFMNAMKEAGDNALNKWKIQPIGGEIRPEAWGKVFDEKPEDPNIQDFRTCVDETHVTWLMDSGMFEKKSPAARERRARIEVARMGYDFHIRAVKLTTSDRSLRVQLAIENRGVAPFYHDWKGEFGIAQQGKVIQTWAAQGSLAGLLPNAPVRIWEDRIDITKLPTGNTVLLLRVPNRLRNGMPIRFANESQDVDMDGWLTLAKFDH